MKRGALITGVLLLIVGVLIATGAISYPDTNELVSVGDASLSVQKNETVPVVVGYVLLGVGALLATASAVMQRR